MILLQAFRLSKMKKIENLNVTYSLLRNTGKPRICEIIYVYEFCVNKAITARFLLRC